MEKLITELMNKVSENKGNNILAYALYNAINENQEPLLIFSNIKDMAKDNYVMIREVLGKELLTDIINFKNK